MRPLLIAGPVGRLCKLASREETGFLAVAAVEVNMLVRYMPHREVACMQVLVVQVVLHPLMVLFPAAVVVAILAIVLVAQVQQVM